MIKVVLGVALAGAAAAFGRKKGSSSGAAPPAGRGFRFVNGCRDLEVTDENAALEWARKFVAGQPAGVDWHKNLILEAVGSCALPLSQNLPLANQIAQKHVTFLWRFALYAVRGAVDSGKLTPQQAEEHIKHVITQSTELGVDPAALTPQTLPP